MIELTSELSKEVGRILEDLGADMHTIAVWKSIGDTLDEAEAAQEFRDINEGCTFIPIIQSDEAILLEAEQKAKRSEK
jgi:hypothetical protein